MIISMVMAIMTLCWVSILRMLSFAAVWRAPISASMASRLARMLLNMASFFSW